MPLADYLEGGSFGDYRDDLPEGEYRFAITDFRDNDPLFSIQFTVLDGPQKNRTAFETLKFEGKALKVARGKLAAIAKAAGCPDAKTLEQLKGKTVRAKVFQNGAYMNMGSYRPDTTAVPAVGDVPF